MILLDTHTLIWLAQSPGELSSAAISAIEEERRESGLALSDNSSWEVAMIVQAGRIRVEGSLYAFLRVMEQNFAVLPITAAIAERSILFTKPFPKDPSDRIIAATAIVHGLRSVTADRAILRSGEVNCVW